MNKCIIVSLILFLTTSSALAFQDGVPNMLPEDFRVYTFGSSGVVNVPYPGTTEKILPTSNAFRGKPGCYIVCYTHDQDNSVYSVGGDIYVTSQIRVKGNYDGGICKPYKYENSDISAEGSFKKLCEQEFPKKCKDLSCWAGGGTGGWFGIQ